MLDLKQLHYFVTVAQLESISRAAARLNMTQSPLSRQIQDLENRLRLRLFDRVKQRVRLTSDGLQFLAQARMLLEAGSRCEASAAALAAGQAGPLRVGYVEAAVHTGLVAGLLDHLRVRSPEVRVELRSLRSASQLEMLNDGRIDLALTHAAPALCDEQLTTRKLIEEPFVFAVPSAWRTSTSPLAADDLGSLTFIAPPESSQKAWRQDFLDACRAAGFEPDIRIEASELATVLELVRGGEGVAIVQESVSSKTWEGICFYPAPSAFKLQLRVYGSIWQTTGRRFEDLRRWVESAAVGPH